MRKATAQYLEYAEANNPLTNEEENLINQNFKNCYAPQIHAWVYCQKASGRKKLFDFLRGRDPKNPTRPMTSFAPSKKDLVIQSSYCRIDLTSTMNYHRPTRRLNVNRFKSNGIIGDQIFGDCKGVHSQTSRNVQEPGTLAKFIIKKLMKSERVDFFMAKSEENLDFLQQLNQYVDKKTNNFPVDNLRSHPTLNPDKERIINKKRNREDHLMRIGGPPQPYEVKTRPQSAAHPWRTPTSAYSDCFHGDPRYGGRMITTSFSPVESAQPFCKFPETRQTEERKSKIDPKYVRQYKEDNLRNRKYKEIFESKTVL